MLKLGEFFFQRLDVFGGHFPDIGIGIAGEFPVVREVLPQRLVLTKDVHDGLEIRMGLCQLAIALLVVENIGFRKFMLKFHELPFQRFELGKHNFSGVTGIDGAMREGTRPARHAVRKKTRGGIFRRGRFGAKRSGKRRHGDFKLFPVGFPRREQLQKHARRSEDRPQHGAFKPRGIADKLIRQRADGDHERQFETERGGVFGRSALGRPEHQKRRHQNGMQDDGDGKDEQQKSRAASRVQAAEAGGGFRAYFPSDLNAWMILCSAP